MSFKYRVLNIATSLLKKTISIAGKKLAPQISAQLAENLSPTISQSTNLGKILFFSPGVLPVYRAQTLLTREPETIEWINTFKESDILWDIGANVGLYTLYAAKKGHAVLAFEPSPSNYYLLGRNIEINKLDNKVLAYCIALNDISKLDTFYMSNPELGGALNTFGEATDWQGKPLSFQLRQAMIGFSIDDFIKQFNPPFPNHIKIDVDGIEEKIIIGAKETLDDKRLKSILIELDTNRKEYFQRVTKIFENAGFILSKKEQTIERENSEFSTVFNHVYSR